MLTLSAQGDKEKPKLWGENWGWGEREKGITTTHGIGLRLFHFNLKGQDSWYLAYERINNKLIIAKTLAHCSVLVSPWKNIFNSHQCLTECPQGPSESCLWAKAVSWELFKWMCPDSKALFNPILLDRSLSQWSQRWMSTSFCLLSLYAANWPSENGKKIGIKMTW